MLTTQTADRWEFRPSSASVRANVIGAAFVVVVCVLMAVGYGFGVFSARSIGARLYFFGFCAFLIAAVAYGLREVETTWRSRTLPLTIEKSGRILYGDRVLCKAGAARSVAVVLDAFADEASFSVQILLVDGNKVELPSPYFNQQFDDREQARALAEELSEALRVGIEYC